MKNFLNHARVYIHAIDDDQVLLAIHDTEIAIIIAITQVTGQEPAIQEDFRG